MAGFNHKSNTMANIIDGKILAHEVGMKFEEDKKFLKLSENSYIGILQLGENTSSDIYVRNKIKFGEKINIKVNLFKYEYKEGLEEHARIFDDISKKIDELNHDHNCLGLIVQSPLPTSFSYDLTEICDLINPSKDLDCMTSINLGHIWNNSTFVLPATVKAVVKILEEITKRESLNNVINLLESKNIVIVNHSIILGRPLAGYLLNHNATVTVCNKFTKDLKSQTTNADILITATGVKGLIKKDMVKDGTIVIDSGIGKDTSNTDNKIYGDVEFEEVKDKVKYITPVPGGVGPMTVACLFDNLFDLNLKK